LIGRREVRAAGARLLARLGHGKACALLAQQVPTRHPNVPKHDLAMPFRRVMLQNFVNADAGTLSQLTAFGELPALLEPSARARRITAQTLA
jgi:hypothetical protein